MKRVKSPIKVALKNIRAEYVRRREKLLTLVAYEPLAKEAAATFPDVEYNAHSLSWQSRLMLVITVKSFRDTMPLLEWFGERGIEFDRSQDWASMGQREYSDSTGFFTVQANVVEGSSRCKAVIIGYETPPQPQPIYKFVCEDEPIAA